MFLFAKITKQNDYISKYYVAVNSRGDVEKIYNSSKALVAQYSYDSWGKVISVLDGNGVTPTSSIHIANLNPFRYRGYYYDDESGFYYLQSRYYDPQTKRFINADDIDVASAILDAIIDKNLYIYCDNNSIMRMDDEGDFWNMIAGAIVGGVTALWSGDNIGAGILSGAISGVCDDIGAWLIFSLSLNPVAAVATIAVCGFVGGYLSNLANQNMNGVKANDLDHASAFREGAFNAVFNNVYDKKLNVVNDIASAIPKTSTVYKVYDKFDEVTKKCLKRLTKDIIANSKAYAYSTVIDGMYANHYKTMSLY